MWTSNTIALGAERSLHVVQAGAGPELVLIHGALTTHHDWLLPAAGLARDHRVTLIDRPGHGLSRRPRFAGSPREQARQIADGLDSIGIERANVIGHSFGGLVALALAEQRPRWVKSLVLLAPIAFPEPRLLEHSFLAPRSAPVLGPILSRLASGLSLDRMMLEYVQRQMFAPDDMPSRWKESFPYAQVLDPDHLVLEGEDAASILPMAPSGLIDLARVEAPVRILVGDRDRIVRNERQGKQLARLLRNATLAEIEGAGHMLHHSHTSFVHGALAETATA
jgi:pimeloyl-ACP methyl ester carboxylesterase